MDPTDASQSSVFSPPYIIPPQTQHTYTAILLHGRGSTAEEFSDDLFSSKLSQDKSLHDKLPGWRWVFPSARETWSTTFEEQMPAWFEAYSLIDPADRQELQVDGIADSVAYTQSIIAEEVRLLSGQPGKVILGGISQGGSIALWALLRQRQLGTRLGGFVGTNTWLPFAHNFKRILLLGESSSNSSSNDCSSNAKDSKTPSLDPFVRETIGFADRDIDASKAEAAAVNVASGIPVFMGHGVDDVCVNVALGREAVQVLSMAGFNVQWKEYVGAELDGHWFKVPDEMDDIYAFLSCLSG